MSRGWQPSDLEDERSRGLNNKQLLAEREQTLQGANTIPNVIDSVAQDQQLDRILSSVTRQKEIAGRIYTEADEQNEFLDNLDRKVDRMVGLPSPFSQR